MTEFFITKGFDLIVGGVLTVVGWIVAGLRKDIADNKDGVKELKQEFNDLKADLPIVYVLKEDYIRVLNNIDDKLNRLIENQKG